MSEPLVSEVEEQPELPEANRSRGWSVLIVAAVIAGLGLGAVMAGRVNNHEESGPVGCDAPEADQANCLPVEIPTSQPSSTLPVLPPLGDLVWAEDFDTLDPSIWTVEHSTFGDGNNELQCYTPDQVSVSGGNLVLRAENRSVQCPNGQIRAQTSGMLRTRALTLSPGQSIGWKVKLTPADDTNQEGLWPAVWSSSWAGGKWPKGGEWDGFEVMTANSPDRVAYGIHFADPSGNHDKKSREVFGDQFSDTWHEFRFDYGHDGVLVWYMDGVETHRVTDAPTLQGYPAPFDQTMTELRINLALGGNPGALNPLALPATLEVDYIRVSEL